MLPVGALNSDETCLLRTPNRGFINQFWLLMIKDLAPLTRYCMQMANLFGACFFTDDTAAAQLRKPLEDTSKLVYAWEKLLFSWRAVIYLVSQHLAYEEEHVTVLAWTVPTPEAPVSPG